jgi:NTE family protein
VLALVMGGGGARAAYQVGFLRALARRYPELSTPIITGVSAGAINASFMAAHPGPFGEAAEDLARLWLSLRMEKVFRVDAGSLAVHTARWALQLVSGGLLGRPRIQSLVDNAPLRRLLEEKLEAREGPIPGIQANLDSGRLRALAVSTSSYSTGRSVIWVQGADIEGWSRPRRQAVVSALEVDHIMASAALPLFFPAVRIGKEWYGDGGIRLTSPLAPAVRLGATHILALSTRFEPTSKEAAQPLTRGYPPPAQVIGSLLNAVFLDQMEADAWRVERVNDLLRRIPPDLRQERRIIQLLTLRPGRDLGQLSHELESRLPRSFRFLVRGLGTQETDSPDVLSFLMFDPEYIARVIDLGEADAEARLGEIEALLARKPTHEDPFQEEGLGSEEAVGEEGETLGEPPAPAEDESNGPSRAEVGRAARERG